MIVIVVREICQPAKAYYISLKLYIFRFV